MTHAAPDLLLPAFSRHMHNGRVPGEAGCHCALTEHRHRWPLRQDAIVPEVYPACEHGSSLLTLLAGCAA